MVFLWRCDERFVKLDQQQLLWQVEPPELVREVHPVLNYQEPRGFFLGQFFYWYLRETGEQDQPSG